MIFLIPREGNLCPEVYSDFKIGRLAGNPDILSVFEGYDLLGYIQCNGKSLVEVLDHNCIELLDTIPTNDSNWYSVDGFKRIHSAFTLTEYDNFYSRFHAVAKAFNDVVSGKKSFNEYAFDFSEENTKNVLVNIMGDRFYSICGKSLSGDVIS